MDWAAFKSFFWFLLLNVQENRKICPDIATYFPVFVLLALSGKPRHSCPNTSEYSKVFDFKSQVLCNFCSLMDRTTRQHAVLYSATFPCNFPWPNSSLICAFKSLCTLSITGLNMNSGCIITLSNEWLLTRSQLDSLIRFQKTAGFLPQDQTTPQKVEKSRFKSLLWS